METLAKPPLIEAIFEFCWGQQMPAPGGTELEFKDEDTSFFTGQFRSVAAKAGYSICEAVPSPFPSAQVPHVPTYRFRKEENKWPCYQLGLGIFTANQVNDGYSWKTFREAISEGLRLLDKGHPLGLRKLPGLGVSLRYICESRVENHL